MRQLILHIPHSSAAIPFKDGFVINDDEVEAELDMQTEWNTDALFYSQKDIMVTTEFSKIFCDVEKILVEGNHRSTDQTDDIFHETNNDGKRLRELPSTIKEKILSEYYKPHHLKISEEVEKQLEEFSKSIIIDCHSFNYEILEGDFEKTVFGPDICIGTDPFHTSQELIDISHDFFTDNNLNVSINLFSFGTFVPLPYYQKDKRVQSIKISVNKKIFGGDNSSIDLDFFLEIQSLIDEYLDLVRNTLIRSS